MPFRVHDGKVKGRLVVDNPAEADRAMVMLSDGSNFIVAPSFQQIGAFTGIQALIESLPATIQSDVEKYLLRIHQEAEAERAFMKSVPWGLQAMAGIDTREEFELSRMVLCNNLVIGRAATLSYNSQPYTLHAVIGFAVYPGG